MKSKMTAMECLDLESIARLLDGSMPPEERDCIHQHLGDCIPCRQLVVSCIQVGAVQMTPADDVTQPPSATPHAPFKGDLLGRYLVLSELGQGGMGVVYAAYDTELDRKVALKLLHSPTDPDAQARLLKEARVLARLNHGNVVSVFDAGVANGHAFVAMELVDGQTLRQWFASKPRSWAEIVRVMVDAGRGLEAAHRAGVIHRDFKPDNVLLGQDGRVRVTDFGLARLGPSPGREPTIMTQTLSTQSNMAVGTPLYMAPEQLDGAQVDARVDVFGFCVTLFEALYDRRPFAGSTRDELRAAMAGGAQLPELPNKRVPPWLSRAVLKGLSAPPAERFGSMTELLSVLDSTHRRRQRAWMTAAGVAVAAVVVGLGLASIRAVMDARAEQRAQLCAGARKRMEPVWGRERQNAVRNAMLSTNVNFAADTWERVRSGLGQYTEAWVNMYTEACEATHVTGEQSGELLDLRMRCLADRLVEVTALVDALAGADNDAMPQAVPAVNGLTPLSDCADAVALRTAVLPPKDPLVRATVDALRERLERVRALKRTGQYEAGMNEIIPLEVEASATAYPALIAEVMLLKGIILSRRARYDDAVAVLEAADAVAADAKQSQVSAMAEQELVVVTGYHLLRFDEALLRTRYAKVLLKQSGLYDRFGYRLLTALGGVMLRKGHFDQAVDYQQQALELCSKLMRSELCHGSEMALGAACLMVGRFDEAEARTRQAVKNMESVLGPNHPDLGKTLTNYGILLSDLARYSEAMEWLQRSQSVLTNSLGSEHPSVANVLNSIGNVHWWRMEYNLALQHHQRAMELRVKAFGPDHNVVANSHVNIGTAFEELGQFSRARYHYERCLDIKTRLLGANNVQTLACVGNLASLALRENRLEEARVKADRVIDLWSKQLGPTHVNLCDVLLVRARVALAMKDFGLATRLLQQVLEIQTINHVGANRHTLQAHIDLARALWMTPDLRPQAVSHARHARKLVQGFPWARACLLQEVDAWLDRHILP